MILKKKILKRFFLIISKSGNTIETISNLLFLDIIKKNSKNVIIISEKKITLYIQFQKNIIYFLLNIRIILAEDSQFYRKLE